MGKTGICERLCKMHYIIKISQRSCAFKILRKIREKIGSRIGEIGVEINSRRNVSLKIDIIAEKYRRSTCNGVSNGLSGVLRCYSIQVNELFPVGCQRVALSAPKTRWIHNWMFERKGETIKEYSRRERTYNADGGAT